MSMNDCPDPLIILKTISVVATARGSLSSPAQEAHAHGSLICFDRATGR
jgi:hypothetical protein